MLLESFHFEFCGKSCGQFANTAQDKSELCTVLFKLNFRSRIVAVVFCTMNESVAKLHKLFILDFRS